jgi:hypothetical protein
MALNFPDAPTANQVYTVGNATWIWDTVKWVASTMASPLPVVNGGTGANNASGALSNLGGAPIASPTFTGDPQAPTPAIADNDTSVATTAFVKSQGYSRSAGVTDGSSAAAGQIGEYLTATGASILLTTTTSASCGTLSLTAGDWDVWGLISYAMSVACTNIYATINTAVSFANPYTSISSTGATITNTQLAAPMVRISLTATTTVYIVAQALFSSGTVNAQGTLWARRVR